MFSLAGVPPLVGFYAKLAVLQALVTTGQAFYIGLAVFAVLMSLIGAFYYLRVVKVMYFDEPVAGTPVIRSGTGVSALAGGQRRRGAGPGHPARRPDDAVPRRHPEGAHQLSAPLPTGKPGATAPDPQAAPAHQLERFVSGEQVFKGALLDVRRDVVAMPDGAHATREYVVHPGAVVVVPLLDDGRLVLERQYRYPVGRVMLEFPAGKIDAGEPALQCAQRELAEETGYRARQWARGRRAAQRDGLLAPR